MPDYTPDYRYLHRTVTVPATTLRTSPQITAYDPGQVRLVEAQIVIPDGHAGQTGIALVYDNQGIVPWSVPVDWVIGNDEEPIFDVDFTIGHAMQIRAFNEGIFEHSFYLRLKVRDISLDLAGAVVPNVLITDLA